MKKFKSLSGEPVRIALLDGHVTYVNSEFEDLDERFHSGAYSSGCVSDDMIKNQAAAAIPVKQAEAILALSNLDDAILAEMKRIVDENDQDALGAHGPNAMKLSKVVGKPVSSHKRDELWHKFQQGEEAK